jgi:hypothetical protein
MPAYPTVDESLDRLHRAGWSVADYGTATRWVVCGGNGGARPLRRAPAPVGSRTSVA